MHGCVVHTGGSCSSTWHQSCNNQITLLEQTPPRCIQEIWEGHGERVGAVVVVGGGVVWGGAGGARRGYNMYAYILKCFQCI